MERLRTEIREFITGNFYIADPKALRDDASLIDMGVVDSTGVLEVISFLESHYGFTVGEDETVPENLDSIARIVAFVARKKGQPASTAP
jgi:acyl carrier protein